MPLLKTTERIFIGYSLPQLPQKNTAERIIREINAANRHKHIQLYVCEYRQLVIDAIPLQKGIDRVIEDCDLAILLFGTGVGPGLAHEARYSLDLFKRGRIHKILPYVFVGDGVKSPREKHYTGVRDVEEFYSSNQVIYYRVEDPDSFGERLRGHIEVWLAEEERIVERQRDFLKRGLLRHFAIDDIAFSDDILAIHNTDKDVLNATRETEIAYRRYLDAPDDELIQERPIHYYLIARHLRSAALENKTEIFAGKEFINPIHQFLAALLRDDPESVRERVIERFESWLRSSHKISEKTRNFAAFQLGMLQAKRSADVLLQCAKNHGELRSVRHYAVHALGMLKQRSMILPLMDAHSIETDPVIKDALTNSILYMMGVIE